MSIWLNSNNISPSLIKQIETDLSHLKYNERNDTKTTVTGYTVSKGGYYVLPFYYGIDLIYRMYSTSLMSSSSTIKLSNYFTPSEYYNWVDSSNSKFMGKLTVQQIEIYPTIMDTLYNFRSTLLKFYTGFGKTTISIHIINDLKLKTCILTHRIILMEQWYESIKRYTPDLKVIIATTDIPTEQLEQYDIIIVNIMNIPKRNKSFWNKFSFVIVDECHILGGEKTFQNLFYFNPQYLLGLTASPEREDGMDILLKWFMGPNWIERNMYRPFNVYIYQSNFSPLLKKNYAGDLDWNKVLKQMTENEKRNNLIVSIVNAFPDRNILVLCKRIIQAKILHSKIKDAELFVSTSKEFNKDTRILISSFSKSGVGFDFQKLDMLIIASDVKNMIIQYTGRVFRKINHIPIIIDIKDKCHILNSHLKERVNYYKSIGGKINLSQLKKYKN